MIVVPVHDFDSSTRRSQIGAVAVTFKENVVRHLDGKFFVVVRAIDRSTQPKVLIIGQEEKGLIQVAKEELTDWQPKGLIF